MLPLGIFDASLMIVRLSLRRAGATSMSDTRLLSITEK